MASISPWFFQIPDGSAIALNSLYMQWYSYRQQHGIESGIRELRRTMVQLPNSAS